MQLLFFKPRAAVLAVLLAVWIGSAELLLAHSDWPAIKDVLLSVPVLYLIACANAITIVLFMELIERDIFTALAWAAIWCILPTVLNTLGMRFDLLAEIANEVVLRMIKIPCADHSIRIGGDGGRDDTDKRRTDEKSSLFHDCRLLFF